MNGLPWWFQGPLETKIDNLSALDVAELRIVYTQTKKDFKKSVDVSLRNFNIFDLVEKATEEFQTNRWVTKPYLLNSSTWIPALKSNNIVVRLSTKIVGL